MKTPPSRSARPDPMGAKCSTLVARGTPPHERTPLHPPPAQPLHRHRGRLRPQGPRFRPSALRAGLSRSVRSGHVLPRPQDSVRHPQPPGRRAGGTGVRALPRNREAPPRAQRQPRHAGKRYRHREDAHVRVRNHARTVLHQRPVHAGTVRDSAAGRRPWGRPVPLAAHRGGRRLRHRLGTARAVHGPDAPRRRGGNGAGTVRPRDQGQRGTVEPHAPHRRSRTHPRRIRAVVVRARREGTAHAAETRSAHARTPDRGGLRRRSLSRKSGGALRRGPQPPEPRNRPRLHARLPVLSGGHPLPARPRTQPAQSGKNP